MPTSASVGEIGIFGLDSNDNIPVDETNGPMPSAHLFRGNGDDKLTGGRANPGQRGGRLPDSGRGRPRI